MNFNHSNSQSAYRLKIKIPVGLTGRETSDWKQIFMFFRNNTGMLIDRFFI